MKIHIQAIQLMEKSPEVMLENGLATYAKHFTAEYRDEKGLWQCPKGSGMIYGIAH